MSLITKLTETKRSKVFEDLSFEERNYLEDNGIDYVMVSFASEPIWFGLTSFQNERTGKWGKHLLDMFGIEDQLSTELVGRIYLLMQHLDMLLEVENFER